MENPKNLLLVIFGASGDLTSRKLMPALFSLKSQNLLPSKYSILGIGRTNFTTNEFRNKMISSIMSYSEEKNPDKNLIDSFSEDLYYLSIDTSLQSEFEKLKNHLMKFDEQYGIGGNYIFYLATPPSLYENIAVNLSLSGLCDQQRGFRRIIIEKPFGYDLESGRKLNRILHSLASEEQIFRIDHYLGKETVQNLLVTRFANGMFEPLWNRNYIVQIKINSAINNGV